MYLNGDWGTICSYDFDDNAAATVCRQLGYFAFVVYGDVYNLQ